MNLFAYLLLLSLFYVILCVNGSDKRKKKKKKDRIIRDGTLNSLVKVLHDKSDIFQKILEKMNNVLCASPGVSIFFKHPPGLLFKEGTVSTK